MVPDFHPIAKCAKPVGTYSMVLMLSGWDWLIQHWRQQTTNTVALVTLACEEHQVITKFSWLRSEPMEASPVAPLPHSGGRLWFPWLCVSARVLILVNGIRSRIGGMWKLPVAVECGFKMFRHSDVRSWLTELVLIVMEILHHNIIPIPTWEVTKSFQQFHHIDCILCPLYSCYCRR